MQAENRFLQQWNSYIRITGESGLRTRKLTQGLISWGMSVQSLVYAAVIMFGARWSLKEYDYRRRGRRVDARLTDDRANG